MQHHRSGKRGGRGRGGKGSRSSDEGPRSKKGYLDESTMMYYRRVSDNLMEENESHEEKRIFLNNVFNNLAEEVVRVAQNQTVSSIVESLIAVASPSNLRTLFVAAAADLSVAFLDRFASHVFESLIQKLPHFFHQPTLDADDDAEDDVAQDKFLECFEEMNKFVDFNFETLSTHTYGSHVLRGLLEALSGVPVAHELKKSQKSGYGHPSNKGMKAKELLKPSPEIKVPEEFNTLFNKYAERVFRECDYEVHLKDAFFSLLLQAVLLMLHKTDNSRCQKHCTNIVQHTIRSCPESENLQDCVPDVAQDAVGSHLLEVIFKLSSGDLQNQIYESLLQEKLVYYAIHPVANYVLQKFFSSVSEKELMEKLVDELSKYVEDILAVGHLGLVTSLAEACKRLRLRQDEFILTLMAAFHCKEPEDRQLSLVKLLTSITAYEVFFNIDEGTGKPPEGAEVPKLKVPVNMHGSLLLQQLLQFQKPKHTALGIVGLQPDELQALCCDSYGSHVVDVFFSTSTVIEKNKDIFLKKMKGLLVETACSRNGSRCLESVWKNLNVKQRTRVAEELAESDRLRGDRFGHFLFYNLGLGLFANDRKAWLGRQGVESKRKRMLKELLRSTEPQVKKQKQKGASEDLAFQIQEDEAEAEDSVTAMFMKHKQDKEAEEQIAQAQTQDSSDEESDADIISTPVQLRQTSTEEKHKKKKKKEKSRSLPDENSESMEDESTSKKKRKKEHFRSLAKEDHEGIDDESVSKKKRKKEKAQASVTEDFEGMDDETISTKKKKSKLKDEKKKEKFRALEELAEEDSEGVADESVLKKNKKSKLKGEKNTSNEEVKEKEQKKKLKKKEKGIK